MEDGRFQGGGEPELKTPGNSIDLALSESAKPAQLNKSSTPIIGTCKKCAKVYKTQKPFEKHLRLDDCTALAQKNHWKKTQGRTDGAAELPISEPTKSDCSTKPQVKPSPVVDTWTCAKCRKVYQSHSGFQQHGYRGHCKLVEPAKPKLRLKLALRKPNTAQTPADGHLKQSDFVSKSQKSRNNKLVPQCNGHLDDTKPMDDGRPQETKMDRRKASVQFEGKVANVNTDDKDLVPDYLGPLATPGRASTVQTGRAGPANEVTMADRQPKQCPGRKRKLKANQQSREPSKGLRNISTGIPAEFDNMKFSNIPPGPGRVCSRGLGEDDAKFIVRLIKACELLNDVHPDIIQQRDDLIATERRFVKQHGYAFVEPPKITEQGFQHPGQEQPMWPSGIERQRQTEQLAQAQAHPQGLMLPPRQPGYQSPYAPSSPAMQQIALPHPMPPTPQASAPSSAFGTPASRTNTPFLRPTWDGPPRFGSLQAIQSGTGPNPFRSVGQAQANAPIANVLQPSISSSPSLGYNVSNFDASRKYGQVGFAARFAEARAGYPETSVKYVPSIPGSQALELNRGTKTDGAMKELGYYPSPIIDQFNAAYLDSPLHSSESGITLSVLTVTQTTYINNHSLPNYYPERLFPNLPHPMALTQETPPEFVGLNSPPRPSYPYPNALNPVVHTVSTRDARPYLYPSQAQSDDLRALLLYDPGDPSTYGFNFREPGAHLESVAAGVGIPLHQYRMGWRVPVRPEFFYHDFHRQKSDEENRRAMYPNERHDKVLHYCVDEGLSSGRVWASFLM